jgi:ribosome recycling factor
LKKFEKEVQNATDKSIADVNAMLAAKEADLKKI